MLRSVLLLCIVSVAHGIFWGNGTTIEQHPYTASLKRYHRHYCGAIIVATNKVLTAAWCSANIPANALTVRVGSKYYHKGGEVIQVIKIHEHPKYKPMKNTLDYEVSVLILARHITIGENAQAIRLAQVGPEVPLGTVGTITGWGIFNRHSMYAPTLQVAEVPRLEIRRCYFCAFRLTERMACYGFVPSFNPMVNTGDEGGPLAINGELYGIVVIGGDYTANSVGLYTKVTDPDIHSHITSCLSLP